MIKYNLQFGQIHFCNLNKYIFEILTNTIGNFIGLQAKKLSDQQAAAEEQNATLESFENIERCQDEGQCFQSSKFPN